MLEKQLKTDKLLFKNQNPKSAREFIEEKAFQLGSVPEIDNDGTIIYSFK